MDELTLPLGLGQGHNELLALERELLQLADRLVGVLFHGTAKKVVSVNIL